MPDEDQEQVTPELPTYAVPQGHRYADPKHSKLISKMFRAHMNHRMMKFRAAPKRKKRA